MKITRRRAHTFLENLLKLGGLVTAAVGLGLMPFLRAIVPDEPVYLVGLIPLLIGMALLGYSYFLAPKD